MKLWNWYWNNQLERINMKMGGVNGKSKGMVNGQNRKFRQFSSNEFWKNIGCLVSAPTFFLGVSRLW